MKDDNTLVQYKPRERVRYCTNEYRREWTSRLKHQLFGTSNNGFSQKRWFFEVIARYTSVGPRYIARFPEFGKVVAAFLNGRAGMHDVQVASPLGSYYAEEFLLRLAPDHPEVKLLSARRRAENRLNNDEWKLVTVWGGFNLKPDHFPHHARSDPTKIGYYQNTDKLLRDVVTIMRPGKYLTKYYSDVYSEAQINKMAAEFESEGKPVEVKFARTEADMIRAVNEGPDESCMSGHNHARMDWFAGHIHPAAAYYGSGDFEIAYLERGGSITARAICNARDKTVARIYGDAQRLHPALKALGYEQVTGALVGLRLRQIPDEHHSGRWIIPYVDAGCGSGGGSLHFTAEGDWFVLTDDEDEYDTYQGYNQSGSVKLGSTSSFDSHGDDSDEDDDLRTCDCCGDTRHYDNFTHSEYHDVDICSNCIGSDERYVWARVATFSGRTAQDLRRRDSCVQYDGDWYWEDDMGTFNLVTCEWSGNVISVDDAVCTVDEEWVDSNHRDCIFLDHDYYDDKDYRYARRSDCTRVDNAWVLDSDMVLDCFTNEAVFGPECVTFRLDGSGEPVSRITSSKQHQKVVRHIHKDNMVDAINDGFLVVCGSEDAGRYILLTKDFFGVPVTSLERAVWDDMVLDNVEYDANWVGMNKCTFDAQFAEAHEEQQQEDSVAVA